MLTEKSTRSSSGHSYTAECLRSACVDWPSAKFIKKLQDNSPSSKDMLAPSGSDKDTSLMVDSPFIGKPFHSGISCTI